MALKAAHAEGITNLAVVHDAFGTTPTKTAQFARILREEFARLYVRSPFERLVEAAVEGGVTCPKAPVPGPLSVEDIARSPYLFA